MASPMRHAAHTAHLRGYALHTPRYKISIKKRAPSGRVRFYEVITENELLADACAKDLGHRNLVIACILCGGTA